MCYEILNNRYIFKECLKIRRITKEIKIGNKYIGGNNPILIQSMTNTKTHNIKETVQQILKLEKEGCQLVRVTIPDIEAAKSIYEIKNNINIPLVGDIHFDYKLALMAIEQGIDKIRINPGNIGSNERVKEIVNAANIKNIPIRVGVNSGSLEKDIYTKYNGVTEEGLVESAINKIKLLEQLDFENIVVSIKSSSVPFSIKSYEILSKEIKYPLHVGITEAGTIYKGTIKSSVGIGAILSRGIGDTIRVSLTGDPIEEIKCCKEILSSLGLRSFGPEIISCPTCGRTNIDLIDLANKVEEICKNSNANIKVAVMGCVVNGPGEAREADIGIAGGNGVGLIFKKGEIYKKVNEKDLLNELKVVIESWQ